MNAKDPKFKLFKLFIIVFLSCALLSCGQQTNDENKQASEQSAPASAGPFQWKLVTSWPKNFPALGRAPEQFASLVNKMSNGRLSIKVYAAGEIVPALEVFDAVSRGTAQMGHSAAYYWKGKIPEAQFFTTIPFGLTAQEMNAWLNYGGGLELWKELYAPFGILPLPGGNSGVQMAGWFNKEIHSINDIVGLKMRIPGLGGEILQRAGGIPVMLPGSELFTALKTGAIDATEWVGPYNDLAFGLFEAAKYYYYPGWHEPGATLEFDINRDAFNQLPPDLQTILIVAAKAVNQDMLDEFTARNNAALPQLVEKHGVKLRALPADVLDVFRRLSDEVTVELSNRNALAKEIYQSFMAFKARAQAYQKVSERAYLDVRQGSKNNGG